MLTIIAGAVAGAVTSLTLIRLQWWREDRLRWNPNSRKAYEAFIKAVERWEELDHHAAVNGELEEWYDAPNDDQVEPLTGVITSKRLRPHVKLAATHSRERLTELELIGSATVTSYAKELSTAMAALSNIRYTSPPRECGGSSEDLNGAIYRYYAARDNFIAAVRHELHTD